MLKMQDLDLKNKRVMIREDFNVPIKNAKVTSDLRIQAALPTIQLALNQHASVIILSHLGRPDEGRFDSELSLEPVAKCLSELLKQEVVLVKDWLKGVNVKPGQVVLCENVRFNSGEKNNDAALSKKMAELCDVFVMDAFATAHRAEASTCGVAKFAPIACAGPLLVKELEALAKITQHPTKPVVAIIGGSKVSTKVKVLKALAEKVDTLIVGGGIANTFIAAAGYSVGGSLYEADFLEQAQQLMQFMQEQGKQLPLPCDVVVADEFSEHAKAKTKKVSEVNSDEKIFDIGPQTTEQYAKILKTAGTILWNGPVGVFEFAQFSQGTQAIAKAVAESAAFSVAGGGDTLAAIEKYHVEQEISYVSTGGGAFLEYLEGKVLPAVAVLETNKKV